MKKLYILLSILLFTISYTQAQQAKIDSSYGIAPNNGVVRYNDYTGGFTLCTNSYLQPDGKLILVGMTGANPSACRLLPTGLADSTFGYNGFVNIELGGTYDIFYDLAIQSDGKIVLVGAIKINTSRKFDDLIMRLLPNGKIDSSFGVNGQIINQYSPTSDEYIRSIQIMSDNKFYVGGNSDYTGREKGILSRYLANGILDSTFGINGRVLISNEDTTIDVLNDIKLQPDGKILNSLRTTYVSTTNIIKIFVNRINNDGSIDNTFGVSGKYIRSFSVKQDVPTNIEVDNMGRIIILALSWVSGNKFNLIVLRLNSNGDLDNTFNGTGYNIDVNYNQVLSKFILIQSDNKIIVGGYDDIRSTDDMFMARYTESGLLDLGFSPTGKVYQNLGLGDFATDICMTADKKLLLCGYSNKTSTSNSAYTVIRYLTDLGIGIDDINNDANNILIYPNPISDIEILEYELDKQENVSINMYDIKGDLVYTFIENQSREAGKNTEQLQMPSNLLSGAYFIKLATSKGFVSIKVIKN